MGSRDFPELAFKPLPVEQAPGFALRAAEQYGSAVWRRIVGDFPSMPLTAVILAMQENPLAYQQLVVDRTNVDKATLTTLVHQLERHELATRMPDPADRRRRVIRLTPAVEHLTHQVLTLLPALRDDLLRPLDEPEASEVRRLWMAVAAVDGTAVDETTVDGSDGPLGTFLSSAVWTLRRVRQLHSRLWESYVPDLTPPQYASLDVLFYKGPLEVLVTARLASLEESNGARILHRLSKRGLIHRENSPEDGRRVVLALTTEGERRLIAATRGVRRVQQHLIRPLSHEQAGRFHSLTARVARL